MALRFGKLAKLFLALESTPSSLGKKALLAGFFRGLAPEDARISAYLVLGTIGAGYEKTDLGIAEKMAVRALASAYPVDERAIREKLAKTGDLGDVAFSLGQDRPGSLTIKELFGKLHEMKDASGAESQERKRAIFRDLLRGASKEEARYITRIVLGNLRLGFADKTLLGAFAEVYGRSKKEVEGLYNSSPDIGELARSLSVKKKVGGMTVGRPVMPMLASRVRDVSEIKERAGPEYAAEEKYDGERMQLHKEGGKAVAFSRRMKDISAQYPEIIREAARIRAESAILDGEVVPFVDGKVLPFQELMSRRRKYGIKEYVEKIPVVLFVFDILYLDGESMMDVDYKRRREALERVVKESVRLKLARRIVTKDFSEVEGFFRKSLEKGLEGIIVKSTSAKAGYEPGRRGWLWIKWKKEYEGGVQDTFDLAVVGSYSGKGSRSGHFGALLCAAYNRKERRFETFTKVGTGFKDEDFRVIEAALRKYERKEKPADVAVEKIMEPDRYYEPGLVIEVLGAQITRSPAHSAGKTGGGKGLALRFPRFIRIREDKGAEDCTTVDEIRGMA